MPYYLQAGTTTANILIYPSATSGTITATSITNGTSAWNYATSSSLLPDGWAWSWNQFSYSWPQYPETAAERAAREQRRAEAIRQAEAHRATTARVNGRAETLLLGLLDEAQARSYIQDGWFEVRGSAGGRYRINRRGQAGNVDELPAIGDEWIVSYCIHPSGPFCDADAHITQYLALVTDEPGFRQTANRTIRRRLPVQMAA